MLCENKFNAAIALKGETKADAAKVMGINPATLFRKMSGQSDFYRKEIDRFCEYYGTDPKDIFFAKNSTYYVENALTQRVVRGDFHE